MDIEQLLGDVSSRLQALGETQITEARVVELVNESFQAFLTDPDTLRKMRFGRDDNKLAGSKFARWGLTLEDIEFLHDILLSARAVGKSSGPSQELQNVYNELSDAYYMTEDQVREIDRQAIDNLFPRIPKNLFRAGYHPYGWSERDNDLHARGAYEEMQAYQYAMRAMDTAESGYGSQLIGAQYVGELWGVAREMSRIFSLIQSFEMTAPTAYLPVEVDYPEMLFVSESTANNSSNYSTVKTGSNRVSVSAKKFVIHQMWSGEMEEDSIIAFVPFLRRQAGHSVAFYTDSLVLNGDTTNAATGNINLDDADPADTKHYLAFDGIRHAGLVDNTGNSKSLAGPISLAAFRDSKNRMVDDTYKVDWGHPNNTNDLVWVADHTTADRVALLDEIVNWKQLNNLGSLLNGQTAQVLGHPVVSSLAMSKTEADGKVSDTGANNIKGQIAGFNRRGFISGWRRRIKTEVERLPATDQTRLVYSLRLGFGRFTPTGAASGIEAADVIYNIDL